MIRFKKVNVFLLFYLVGYWSLIIFTTIFVVKLSVAVLFSISGENPLHFNWLLEFKSAIKKGVTAGAILGAGIWIKAKLGNKY